MGGRSPVSCCLFVVVFLHLHVGAAGELEGYVACGPDESECNPTFDILEEFAHLRSNYQLLGEHQARLAGYLEPTPIRKDCHWQGMAHHPKSGLWFVSQSLLPARDPEFDGSGIVVMELDAGTFVGVGEVTAGGPRGIFPGSPLWHYGGMQVIGDYLVVGLDGDSGEHPIVAFLDLRANPRAPRLAFSFELPGYKAAGSVGVAKLSDGRYLVGVHTSRGGVLVWTFWVSRGASLSGLEEFTLFDEVIIAPDSAHGRLSEDCPEGVPCNDSVGRLQSHPLFVGVDGRIYAVATHMRIENWWAACPLLCRWSNVVEVWQIDLSADGRRVEQLVKRDRVRIGENHFGFFSFIGGVHFAAASGVYFEPGRGLFITATEFFGDDFLIRMWGLP